MTSVAAAGSHAVHVRTVNVYMIQDNVVQSQVTLTLELGERGSLASDHDRGSHHTPGDIYCRPGIFTVDRYFNTSLLREKPDRGPANSIGYQICVQSAIAIAHRNTEDPRRGPSREPRAPSGYCVHYVSSPPSPPTFGANHVLSA